MRARRREGIQIRGLGLKAVFFSGPYCAVASGKGRQRNSGTASVWAIVALLKEASPSESHHQSQEPWMHGGFIPHIKTCSLSN